MTYQIRKANRGEAKPLVGLYGISGSGKTWSSLLLARGFSPQGRVVMIETEGGRGECYADMVEGSYDVISMRDSFAPIKFGQAISAAEQVKPDVLIIDSASLEWEGVGGVLDMAAENQAKGMKGPLVWQKPKMDHSRHFMLRVLQTPIPLVILSLRARYPMVEKKLPDGKKEWIRSEELEPIQAGAVLFELFIHAWIDQEHRLHVTKLTRPDLGDVFVDNEPISLQTGARLRDWVKGLPAPTSRTMQAAGPADATIGTAARASAGSRLDVPAMAREAAQHGRAQLRAYCRTLVGQDYTLVTQQMKDELESLIPKEDAKQ
jgi:hypothetical protein